MPKYDALLTCFSTPRMALQPGDVAVERAMSYDPSGLETVISADLLPTVDTLTIPDALANDPYFASSYRLRPSSLVWALCACQSSRRRPSDRERCCAGRYRYRQERYDDFRRADRRLLELVSWNGAGDTAFTRSAADNCVMLSAEWYANRRYTVELSYRNPPAPTVATAEEISVWLAPLSGEAALLGGSEEWAEEVGWSYAIRGHKYGTVCGADGGPDGSSSGSSALSASASSAFAASDAASQVQEFAFGDATNRARRTTAGLAALAEELCEKYGEEKTKLEAGQLSDQLVPGAMWRAFQQDSVSLVDWQVIHETNVSLYPRALDGRRPGVPTREHGIGHRCATLKGACDPVSLSLSLSLSPSINSSQLYSATPLQLTLTLTLTLMPTHSHTHSPAAASLCVCLSVSLQLRNISRPRSATLVADVEGLCAAVVGAGQYQAIASVASGGVAKHLADEAERIPTVPQEIRAAISSQESRTFQYATYQCSRVIRHDLDQQPKQYMIPVQNRSQFPRERIQAGVRTESGIACRPGWGRMCRRRSRADRGSPELQGLCPPICGHPWSARRSDALS
eukprot:COSAG03_NODE_898_length_5429_cov_1.947467_1_plen_569_part_10